MVYLPREPRCVGWAATIALPLLDAMDPSLARVPRRQPAASPATLPPRRLATFFLPNGMNMEHWLPEQTGEQFEIIANAGAAPALQGPAHAPAGPGAGQCPS